MFLHAAPPGDEAQAQLRPRRFRHVEAKTAQPASAAAFGYALDPGLVDQQIEVTKAMGPYRPSSLIDFLAGRPVELDAIWGEPLRRARAAGCAVPALARLCDQIRASLG